MNRFSFFLGASLLVTASGCRDDDVALAPGSTVINGATATVEVTETRMASWSPSLVAAI